MSITSTYRPWRVLMLLFIVIGQAFNQSGDSKIIEAYALLPSDELHLDGRVDEDFWHAMTPISDLLMQVPVEGMNPTEKSEIRVAYDQNNLYIAIIFKDGQADRIKAYQKRRDAALDTDDSFQWILDTFLDGRNAYYFAINPAGLIRDGLLTVGQGTSLNLNWDGIWRAWTQVDTEGWSAEIRIPFRTLNFDPSREEWGINFQRTIRRKNEELLWSGYRRGQGLLRPQNAGVLKGLKDISQGIGLEAVPYVAARRLTTADEESKTIDYQADAGFDINYSITPGLKASITYNTDFAEAEVDTRRINLTRFPLVFPEKRDFFLEGSSIYSFAPASGIVPYFSRRIGLREGRTIPISLGGRLLGRIGDYDLALQHVRTGRTEAFSPEDFTIARIKRNVGKESRIGLVYTRRSTDYGDGQQQILNDRHTIGTDLELNTSRFLGHQNLQFQAFFVYHNNENPTQVSSFWDRSSRGIRLNFPNRPWSGHVSYREFGEAFSPALGFHPRVGFRRLQPSLGFNPLFEKSDIIREASFGLRFEHLMDMDWTLLTQQIRFELLEITFESFERFQISVERTYERLTSEFDILRDGSIVIPTGDYPNWIWNFELSSASYRPVSARVDIETGGFWSGQRTELGLSLTLRPLVGLNMTGTYLHTEVSLLEGDFSTDLLRYNISFDFSPFLTLSSFIQWDNLSDRLGVNNRFQWILASGHEIFFVYNHDWENRLNRFVTLNNAATMKATYTHRF